MTLTRWQTRRHVRSKPPSEMKIILPSISEGRAPPIGLVSPTLGFLPPITRGRAPPIILSPAVRSRTSSTSSSSSSDCANNTFAFFPSPPRSPIQSPMRSPLLSIPLFSPSASPKAPKAPTKASSEAPTKASSEAPTKTPDEASNKTPNEDSNETPNEASKKPPKAARKRRITIQTDCASPVATTLAITPKTPVAKPVRQPRGSKNPFSSSSLLRAKENLAHIPRADTPAFPPLKTGSVETFLTYTPSDERILKTETLNKKGLQYWMKDGEMHRDDDMPALICPDGEQRWFRHGVLHRDNDRPAVICADGSQEWWINGAMHRDNDLPARIDAKGGKEWWFNGRQHRISGRPSVVYSSGYRAWHVNGVKCYEDNTRRQPLQVE